MGEEGLYEMPAPPSLSSGQKEGQAERKGEEHLPPPPLPGPTVRCDSLKGRLRAAVIAIISSVVVLT